MWLEDLATLILLLIVALIIVDFVDSVINREGE